MPNVLAGVWQWYTPFRLSKSFRSVLRLSVEVLNQASSKTQQRLLLSLKMLCALLGAGHSRWETVWIQSNACLLNPCPDCLYNIIGEFEILAKTYLWSPGEIQDVSRNVLNCVFWLLAVFNLCCICFGAYRVWYPGPLISCSSLCGDVSSTDMHKL